jgi:Na+-driven multidrug efflux pump
MDSDKEKQEISLIGRILSMEVFLLLAGLVFLVTGMVRKDVMALFWGAMIFAGSLGLHFVRKKDWKKHWEEQEQMRQAFLEKKRQEQERKDREKNNG